MTLRPAVFVDRDGVLNRAIVRDGRPGPPMGPEELELLSGVHEACAALRAAGFVVIVITNQPDVARGTQRRDAVEAMHRLLRSRLPIDDIRVCYHDDGDRCACRKPEPGLLIEAARDWGVDLAKSFMVGDRWRDLDAGRRAGCTTILVEWQHADGGRASPDHRVRSLAEAASWIVEQDHGGGSVRLVPELPESPQRLADLRVKIYADGADRAEMLAGHGDPLVRGFTTNPTLMRRAGITDYRAFARDMLQAIPDRPISFEVIADEFPDMERQAREIAGWGDNVYVKIPITDTRGRPASELIRRLAGAGIKLNITALLTLDQVQEVARCLEAGPSSYVSVFAGRIADTGRDPSRMMAGAVELLQPYPQLELVWASPRELLNVFQANAVGCHIITLTHDLMKKLRLIGKDLPEYSRETVRMFRADAVRAGYQL